MNPIVLHRKDPARNLARFYRLELQPDLFGQWCFISEWGRIGRGGRVRAVPFPSRLEAAQASARQRAAKERRGYRVIG